MKLRLRSIGPFRDEEFELGRMTVICGPPGSGKTVLGSALELLLTGRTSLVRIEDLCGGRGEVELEEDGFRMRAEIHEGSPPAFTSEEGGRRLEGREAVAALQARLGFKHPRAASFLARLRHAAERELIRGLGSISTAAAVLPEVLEALRGRDLEDLPEVKRLLECRISPQAAVQMLRQKAERIRREAERIERTLLPPEIEVDGKAVRLDGLDPETARKALEKLKDLLRKAEEAEQAAERRRELEKRRQLLEKAAQKGEEVSRYRSLLEERQALREKLGGLRMKIRALDCIKARKTCPILGGSCTAAASLDEEEIEQYMFDVLAEFEKTKKELLRVEEEIRQIDAAVRAAGSPKELEAELRRIKEEIQRLPEPERGLPSAESLRERIRRGETVLQYLSLYREQEGMRGELNALREKLRKAEEAAAVLEPFTGRPWISPELARTAAAAAESLGIDSIRLEGGRLILPAWPSRSEAVLTEALLKTAALEFSGGGLLMADDLDWAAPEPRRALLRYIHDRGLSAVLMLRTEQPPAARGDVRIIYLGGGGRWSR